MVFLDWRKIWKSGGATYPGSANSLVEGNVTPKFWVKYSKKKSDGPNFEIKKMHCVGQGTERGRHKFWEWHIFKKFPFLT